MSQVSLKNIRKSYDGTTDIIKGVDLEVASGEFLVLVGPSGCGKSTLLRMIAGLEEITAGTLSIADRIVNDVPPRDRGIGMVFQSYALYPHMTVRENMGFGLKIRKVTPSEIDSRVQSVAAMLDLTDYLERHPKNLSGGQRQRVAMGRAIVRQPDVFLFDEPLSNLDAALRTQMRVELKKLHRELQATMLYVTHDQIEAMTLADRIMILNQGVVQQVGTPSEIFEAPKNRFVASFIGAPAMNFIEVPEARTWQGSHITFDTSSWSELVHTIGIRPQHLQLEPHDHVGGGLIKGEVDVIEPMGWEAYVHIRLADGQMLTSHVEMDDIRTVKAGDAITLHVSPDRLHMFDIKGDRLEGAARAAL